MTALEISKNIRVVPTLLILAMSLSYVSGYYVVYKKPNDYRPKETARRLQDSLDFLKESAIHTDNILTVLNILSKLYKEDDVRRQGNRRPSVEIGPGSIKSPILEYPEKYFEKKLKHLIKLQQQQEERNKDLNGSC